MYLNTRVISSGKIYWPSYKLKLRLTSIQVLHQHCSARCVHDSHLIYITAIGRIKLVMEKGAR